MRPIVNYPAAQIVGPSVSSTALSTSASTVVRIPNASGGSKPSFVRVAISAGTAHVRIGTDTSTSAVTSDSIITSTEALWLNTLGLGAVAARQTTGSAGTAGAVISVSACEEGSISPSTTGTIG